MNPEGMISVEGDEHKVEPTRQHFKPVLADVGIVNRATARQRGLRNPKKRRALAMPSKVARFKTRRSK